MELQESLIHIGDRVVGNRTGQLIPSTVIGIITAELYVNTMAKGDHSRWNEIYPDWSEKLVVIGKFDEPQKSVTRAEVVESFKKNTPPILAILFNNGAPQQVVDPVMDFLYEQIPETISVAYPIDDVAIL